MPETPTPGDDKNRRNRSFGSFLLFLFVLIVILVVVGNETLTRPTALTQDEYQYFLHKGRIVQQTIEGTREGSNLIRGTYLPIGDPKESPFEVKFANADERETEFQDLLATRYREISSGELIEGIESGRLTPLEARALVTVEEQRARVGPDGSEVAGGVGAGAGEGAPEVRGRREREELFVHAIDHGAAPAGDFAEATLSSEERLGHVWYHVGVDRSASLGPTLDALRERGVPIGVHRFALSGGQSWKSDSSFFTTFLLYYAPWILIIVVFMIFMRQLRAQGGAGGVMSFARSRAQMYSKENRTNVTFDDVAGAQEAKDEVREIVEFLRNPGRFTRIGGRIPRGVLLVGPPGCGKTLLAKAIAGEAEVPFFSISGSDFVEMFVGVGASRVRDLFKQARENSPCIIFLDEIDAVGRRRGSGMGGGHDEREQTLNAILVEMDGFGTDEGIIVIAATNRPDVLDPALLRPGRFDREVTIDLPDFEGRAEILKVHLKRVKVEEAVDIEVLARSTPGYSGADLAAIVNEAAIMAVLAKRDAISMDDLEEARDKVRYGRQKKSRKIEEEDRKITAVHESGHAVVAAAIEETDPPHKVTIVPRGRALGATMMLPTKESYHMQKRRLLGQLAVMFGGRVAEAEIVGDVSAGASDDISRATDIARAMVTELGMSEKIGPINYAERQGSDFLGTELMRGKLHSEETARQIDEEVKRLLDEAYARAVSIVRAHRAIVEEMGAALMHYETINASEVDRLMKGVRAEDLRPDDEPIAPVDAPRPSRKPSEGRAPGDTSTGEISGEPGLSPA